MTFSIVVLVCSMSLSHSDCQPWNAIDVVQGPKVKNEVMCGLFGETQLAQTAIAPRPGEEYTKVMCIRQRDSADAD